MAVTDLVAGKVAIVTGGGSGIGKGAALRLAQQGAKVGLLELKEEDAREVRAEIERAGGEALVVETDVSKPTSVEAAVKKVVERFGRIDIVFANAGINGTWTPIEDLSPDDWDTTLGINLRGTFLTVKYAVPHMKENGGSVVITSSVNGTRNFSNIGASAYSTSKAGQVAFAKMAALELARYKIRVNVICPGAIETNIGENTNQTEAAREAQIPVEYPEGTQPLEGKAGTPEQVGDLVLFLVSPLSSHISGAQIFIDGAESLLVG